MHQTAGVCALPATPGRAPPCLQLLMVPCSVAAKSRTFWIVVASTLLPSSLLAPEPALAQACGPPVSGNVTCTSSGNPYPGGISYSAATSGDLHVTLQLGVNVGPAVPGTRGVSVSNFVGGGALVTANGAISTQGPSAYGIFASSPSSVTIDNNATINTNGFNARGINVEAPSGTVVITNTGIITTQGDQAAGIWVPDAGGTGPASTIVTNSANITTNGAAAASAIRITLNEPGNTGSATINQNGGVITTNGAITSAAIIVGTNGPGTAIINMNGGTLINNSPHQDSHGLTAQAQGTGDAEVHFNAGSITTHGGIGAVAWNAGLGVGNITLTSAPGTIVNALGNTSNSNGLAALGGSAAAGTSVRLDSQSVITATNFGLDGQSQMGAPVTVTQTGGSITAGNVGINVATGGVATVTNSGPITTSNDASTGIRVAGDGAATVQNNNTIVVQGAGSTGISALAASGAVNVTNTSSVTSTGSGAIGVLAGGAGPVTVTNSATGNVLGGGSAGGGVSISGGSATLINDGTIGALSDRAVFGSALIANNGTMTGFVQLAGVNDYVNNGVFNLRHFADTDGDGIRDTLRVAVADLGSGLSSTFTNNGTLTLLGGPGATTLDSSGQYLPFGNAFNTMSLNGPVQGQILGVKTFSNSGVIDLTANPVPGDVLVISGGHTAGTDGGGVFVANGGTVRFNTVLNEGGANSQSDVLVADSTRLGSAATKLAVSNFGGSGALTVGDGIGLVEVLNKGASDPSVFTLGNPAVAGPYEYTLFHGGVGADASDGNWYLRSTINCALAPSDPACQGPTPPPNPVPNFRQEVSLFAAIPALTLLYGRALIETLHERVGEEEHLRGRRDLTGGAFDNGGWARIIGEHGQRNGDPSGILGSGPKFDYGITAVQGGHDVYRIERADGSRDHAGFYAAAGLVDSNVTHFTGIGAGADQLTAASAGAYWTHFGAPGWYLDGVLQGTWYNATGDSHRGLGVLSTNGAGFAASLEGGYPIRFGGGFTIEPQAQVVYQNVSLSDSGDSAAQVRFDNIDSLAARAGVRIAETWALDAGPNPRLVTAWVRPNLWREFRGDPVTAFSSATGFVPFHADLGGNWAEINVGVSTTVNRTTALYANASYQTGLDGRSFAYDGKLGIRMNW
jgi:autotransporter family porin